MPRTAQPLGLRLALFAAIYVGMSSTFVAANRHWPIGEAFWPYTGIGLAGILLFGFRIWPLILALNFLLQLTHYSPGIAAAQALSETVEVCTAGWLLEKAGFRPQMERFRDALLLLAVGGLAGAFLGAGLKQLVLLMVKVNTWEQFKFFWLAWWRGDGLGIVIFTPILLSWMGSRPQNSVRGKRLEAAALLLTVGVLSFAILGANAPSPTEHNPLVDLFFVVVFWAATRFGIRGGVTIAGVAAFVTLIEALRQFGNAPPSTFSAGFRDVWIFLSVLAGSSLLMATAIAERAQVNARNAQWVDAFRAAAIGVSEGTGERFFQLLVQHLAVALRVDAVFVGAVSPSCDAVHTLAFFSKGELKTNFDYGFQGTPCREIFSKHRCYYPTRAAQAFPGDPVIQELAAEAYLAVPLFSSNMEPLGLVAVLHPRAIEDEGLADSILQIYSTRAAAELERLRTEESLRHSEERFRQVQKMQALGTLAGGIAHDFNNVLTVIKGGSSLALDNVPKESPAYEDLCEVQKAADRAAALTGHLLAFSRQQIVRKRTFEINDSIRDLSKMLHRVLGEDIKLKTDFDPGCGSIDADPAQFDQVIMNLAVNGRDAMPNGGTLVFATRKVRLGVKNPLSVKPGAYVEVNVADSGVGMDRETQERIFEPFFTTKPVGQGTGLGLATVYGIMQQLEGHVSVLSELGKGATFRLLFPCSVSKIADMAADPKVVNGRGDETILLVEDDAALRHLVQRILDTSGYTVLSAGGVQDAERILQEFTGKIALVVTDVVMPDGGGEELVAKLTQKRPETKVLFISGYTDGRVPEKYLAGDQAGFLAKPFEPAELTAKVRRVLDDGHAMVASSSL